MRASPSSAGKPVSKKNKGFLSLRLEEEACLDRTASRLLESLRKSTFIRL